MPKRTLAVIGLAVAAVLAVAYAVLYEPPADDVAAGGAPVAASADAEDASSPSSESTVREPGAPDDAKEDEEDEETTTTAPTRPAANTLQLRKFTQIGGSISPKSVVASGNGVVTAQNMMYTHTVTAYDRDGKLIATVPDDVVLSDFGIDKPGSYKGAPVEAAFVSDGSKVYVSNYSMYGPGFREGSDKCSPSDGVPPSYLYRIDTETWKIDQVVPVGAVPKYVAVTPDDELVLTTNWCTFDMTISSTEAGETLRTVQLGRYPRGIVVSPDSSTAWVAVMGSTDIARVNLADGAITWFRGIGQGPRHLVLSPDGSTLYATLNSEGRVAKIDAATGEVLAKVATGSQPRSMAISTDGSAVYVVNYESDSMTKLDTATMTELQTLPTGHHPIGITYDDATGRVWVANYGGTIDVYDEVAGA